MLEGMVSESTAPHHGWHFFLLFLLAWQSTLFSPILHAETWYVRADGAPHYTPGIAALAWRGLDPKHTCDGLHDAGLARPGQQKRSGQSQQRPKPAMRALRLALAI